ncbi:cyclic di-GMP phosphodiesterase response regulator RpfG [Ferrovum sp. JA12]|uniref:HD domain-containing phosphohydrolase n=1 Tax=Ferrovum sp. JA12 TaxID=1356299 RepID=UPI000703767E|nr:HD domain-containing phosphohydrolase [Ferrovum sp. JA12]KRH78186.1 cyclic di-GMP phosphodiesterase response regulator RpfG [Ferrovum sp. JA12]
MIKSDQQDYSFPLLQSVVESVPRAVFWKDRHSRYLGCNTLFAHYAGLTHPDEVIGKTDFEMAWKDQADIYRAEDIRVMESGILKLDYIEPKNTPDGQIIWLRMLKVALRDANQNIIGMLGIYEDVTAQKQIEDNHKMVTRALNLLSKCTSVLVHAQNEEELLTKVCKLAVEGGGYLMAWSGFAEHDAAKTVRPVAQSGYEEDYLDRVTISWSDTELGQGPTGTAIRTGTTVVNQDCLTNPKMAPWREAALKRGYQSSIALPLIFEKRILGALTVYASEPYAFVSDEVALLEELTKDLAYGIQSLRTRAEHDLIVTQQRQHDNILRQSLEDSIKAIADIIEARDPYTSGHQSRVSQLAVAIAKEIGLSEDSIVGLKLAASVHDLGKISIPAEILTKPGRLTDVEYKLVQQHAQSGYDILKNIKFPWPIATVVWQHHERMNGTGYPQGLQGDQILLESRILAVADVFDAMASYRPYRPALGAEVALKEIEQGRDSLYDTVVVDACLKLFREGKLGVQV